MRLTMEGEVLIFAATCVWLSKSPGELGVFVVWEPVLARDVRPPSRATMARVPDPRVSQWWDPERRISAELQRVGVRPSGGDVVRVQKSLAEHLASIAGGLITK